MGLGQLTKQLAQQAIGNQVKEAVEGIVPADTSTPSAPVETMSSMMLGETKCNAEGIEGRPGVGRHVQAGGEVLRVREIYVRSPQVAVVTGTTGEKALTRVICPFDSMVLVCKPAAVTRGRRPYVSESSPPNRQLRKSGLLTLRIVDVLERP